MKGWKLEPGRHALAAKGVKTGRKANEIKGRNIPLLISPYHVDDTERKEIKGYTDKKLLTVYAGSRIRLQQGGFDSLDVELNKAYAEEVQQRGLMKKADRVYELGVRYGGNIQKVWDAIERGE